MHVPRPWGLSQPLGGLNQPLEGLSRQFRGLSQGLDQCLEAVDFRATSIATTSAFSRFHQNVVILLVAIPPTNLEAADTANRFRFQNPDLDSLSQPLGHPFPHHLPKKKTHVFAYFIITGYRGTDVLRFYNDITILLFFLVRFFFFILFFFFVFFVFFICSSEFLRDLSQHSESTLTHIYEKCRRIEKRFLLMRSIILSVILFSSPII